MSFCVWLLSLSTMFARSIRVLAGISPSFHLMAKYQSTAWLCHILFIRPSLDGHLDCFHFLACMNSAPRSIHVEVFGGHTSSFLLVYPGVEWLGHVVTLRLTFRRTARPCSAAPLRIPTGSAEGSDFSISSTLAIVCLCYFSLPSAFEVVL